MPMTPEERAREIIRLEGPKIVALVHAAASVARASLPAAKKRQRVIEIAEDLSRTITPHTACSRGCSECCHMSTKLSGHEAAKIGRFLGREPRRLGRGRKALPGLADELRVRYTGVPCPFLAAGRCAIYPVRPIACRTHHTMMDDETSCRVRLDADGRAANPTPALNLSGFAAAVGAVFGGEEVGDIREFFPSEAQL
jgi:Fe-S-cluster containining protein